MSIFDGAQGQALAESLSDENIYGDQEERQEEATPQEQPDNSISSEEPQQDSPDDNQTSTNAEEPQEQETNNNEQRISYEQLQKNYDELRQWATRTSMLNTELKKQLSGLNNNKQTDNKSSANSDEEAKKELLRTLISDPNKIIEPLVEAKIKPIIEERANEKRKVDFENAVQSCSKDWPQLKSPESSRLVISKMVELSQRRGNDPMAWRDDPMSYMILACHSLFGVRNEPNMAALEAAREVERNSVIAEMNNKRGKEALSISKNVNADTAEKELTPEEQIVAGIMKYAGSGLFKKQ